MYLSISLIIDINFKNKVSIESNNSHKNNQGNNHATIITDNNDFNKFNDKSIISERS